MKNKEDEPTGVLNGIYQDAIFREEQFKMNPEGDPLQELTRMFEQLCRLHGEGQHDLAPLIHDTWERIMEVIESEPYPRIMVRNKRDK